jgi:hypothetical protein
MIHCIFIQDTVKFPLLLASLLFVSEACGTRRRPPRWRNAWLVWITFVDQSWTPRKWLKLSKGELHTSSEPGHHFTENRSNTADVKWNKFLETKKLWLHVQGLVCVRASGGFYLMCFSERYLSGYKKLSLEYWIWWHNPFFDLLPNIVILAHLLSHWEIL